MQQEGKYVCPNFIGQKYLHQGLHLQVFNPTHIHGDLNLLQLTTVLLNTNTEIVQSSLESIDWLSDVGDAALAAVID